MNSVYHKYDYLNYTILNNEDIDQIKTDIKYIIVNLNLKKIGLVLNLNNNDIFIPINVLKHNIDLSNITKPTKYLYDYIFDY